MAVSSRPNILNDVCLTKYLTSLLSCQVNIYEQKTKFLSLKGGIIILHLLLVWQQIL